MGLPPLLCITPFGRPDPHLAAALARAGVPCAIDLGADPSAGAQCLWTALDGAGSAASQVGVHLQRDVDPALLAGAAFLILAPGMDAEPYRGLGEIHAQVRDLSEARAALDSGATALIAKGSESGGRVGTRSTFILLQQLLESGALPASVPIRGQGGIGAHTAAGCLAGGAAGFVLDSALALANESRLPAGLRERLATLDGSETVVVGEHRVLRRPDVTLADALKEASVEEVAARIGAEDLDEQLLPVGEDIGLATILAERYRTAGGIAHAVEAQALDAVGQANRQAALGPEAALAREHGCRFPVVQGPMTRVSDGAEFAAAVAEGGGLPFLALSLMDGEQVRSLVQTTRERLGTLPFGVGLLGFLPVELREKQLEVLRDLRPPFALIAGGRPSQARALEDLGTPTYLHVPSPGLLDLFLDQGARRFVFEGRECGGHVGPRSSFSLWEAQLQRLAGFEHPEELRILFAGGIHDERSAAMVAALAAPLVERGARVGVLMGSAYIFTDEAVSSGAIDEGYRQTAVACKGTELVETAPGHATRCAATPFVEAFRDERARLEETGAESRDMWATLERMNLGRLRIASKGLRRDAGELVPVGDEERARTGMFMLGEVAALRAEAVSVLDLHRQVSEGACEFLVERAQELFPSEDTAESSPMEIAIIGMAGIFPGAGDLDSFWSNVVRGVDSLRDVDPVRWNPEIYCDPDGAPGETIPSPRGGFLDPVVLDPTKEGIPPKSMASIEPVQLLSLEIARRALSDAGYATREFDRASTSVIFGAEGGNDLAGALGFRVLYKQLVGEVPSELEACLPQHTEDTFPGVLANVIAGRIANRLDLGGFNYTVDAACASSLAALECGVQSLLAGTSSMVLVGGADLHNSVNDYMMFSSVQALSATGRSRPFDAEADGIVLGEAVGTVVLKRRADAERDGDRIYALIQSSAGSSDGKSLGMTAPRLEGQVRAMNRAYERLPYGPAQVGLVEAHGTGTVVGDRTELASMTQVFRADGAATAGCTLGSVKSQIGHTKCAAGIASLIKGALSLHHRVLPSTLGIKRPNRGYQAEESPFEFRKASAPWPQPQGGPRVAGVSSFGFGGTNFHVVLEEYEGLDDPDSHLPVWPEELFLLRGVERGEAEAGMDALVECLNAEDPWSLRELAHATSLRGTGPVQVALLAKDTDQLAERLRLARTFEAAEGIWVRAADAPESAPRVAFLVPGQGSQYPGMLQQLFLAFPQLSDLLAQAGPLVSDLFPSEPFDHVQLLAQRNHLAQTERAQPALGLCGLAMGRLLQRVGVEPDWLGGHSYGELVALALAGALPEERLLELSSARAEAILSAVGDDPGTMAAVAASEEETAAALHGVDDVVLANLNGPRQTVISGPTGAVNKALDRLDDCGFAARSIPVACAFHSGVVADAKATFGEYLRAFPIAPPSVPVFSNTTAAPHAADPELIRSALSDQIVQPVRFADQVQAMVDAGARIFVEVGPGRVLTGLVSKILAEQQVHVISTNESGCEDLSSFLSALAQLSVLGVDLDPAILFEGRTDGGFDLDAPPERALAPLAWKVDGFRAIPVSGIFPPESLRPCATPPVEMVPRGSEAAIVPEVSATPEDDAQATVLEYLKNVSDTLEAQRQVVLAYLGSAAPDLVRQVEAAQLPATASRPDVKAEAAAPPGPPPPVESVDEAAEEPTLALDQELLRIVSERTGYPEDMLDLDLDLEADLGIDSIKRIEILGALNNSSSMDVGTEEERDALVEQLASIKTLRGILEWIETQTGEMESSEPTAAQGEEHTEPSPATAVNPEQPLRRYAPTLVDVPALNGNRMDVSGRHFALTDDRGGVARALASGLENLGARVRLMEDGARMNGDGHLIHLAPLASDGGPDDVRALFALTQAAAPTGLESLCTATRSSGMAGGAAGFAKSYAKEHPNSRVRIVHLDPDSDPGVQAELLLAEICATDDTLEISYSGGCRQAVQAAPLLWSGPDEEGDSPLDSDSVVLITGGARGIAGCVTTGLAQRFGCHFEVVGRSALPEGDEEARFNSATSIVDLRRLLIEARSGAAPAEIDAAAREILGAREIRATLKAVRSAGGTVRYQSVDVRARRAFGKYIDQIYDERGRLDGVIHAAGVIEDKLLTQKTQESFDRVFDTKVLGAHTIAQHVRDDLRFLVFFSSISGAFGNRGQADYAAANDHLDQLAHSLAKTHPGRILSINWGPWEGAGMVGPDLQSEYERRGIGLIPLEGGVQALVRELGVRGAGPSQVMLMNADPEQLR
ncbi:MAG TPA: SDR family NAD(P)-dependent oxidoreductase [Planctomycetes bacterium]|nr:SDR family NAD(P)-dependent oxidoreductase [Planctomycetota bacterium]HIK59637.1 SDR family NAD(P)-dependent oxidoreductase [Planctomycetota bacterium]